MMKTPHEPLTPIRQVHRAVRLIEWYGTEEERRALLQAIDLLATKGNAVQRRAIMAVADQMRARPGWRKRRTHNLGATT